MLLPVHEDTDIGVVPGLIGNGGTPAIRAADAPAAQQRNSPPGSQPKADMAVFWTRMALPFVLFVVDDFIGGLPWWAFLSLWVLLMTVPDAMLRKLIPDWMRRLTTSSSRSG